MNSRLASDRPMHEWPAIAPPTSALPRSRTPRQAIMVGLARTDFESDLEQHDLDEADASAEWDDHDIVQLHWLLLAELRQLTRPETPLEEKLDTLAWALTEPERDQAPFSLANCLRVVGLSPISPTPYFGELDVDRVKSWIRHHARSWLNESIAQYPAPIQQLVQSRLSFVAGELERNPQWLNEQAKAFAQTTRADLFGGLAA